MSQASIEELRRIGTYLITFCCHGKWLPGQIGAIDRSHNLYGHPGMRESRRLERHFLPAKSTTLDEPQRMVVREAILEVCRHRRWNALALHVRSDHVHAIVSADKSPEEVMVVFKRYASRALNSRNKAETGRWWARHGSTRYLQTNDDISSTIQYVVGGQGDPMACWMANEMRFLEPRE